VKGRGALAPTLIGTIAACVLCAPGTALASRSVGTPQQISWVRSAAERFIKAELAGDGSSACAILIAPLRATIRGRSCAERWDRRLKTLLRSPAAKAALKTDARAVAHAPVNVRGDQARIALPHPLLGRSERFRWTENCWMLER
jgi:hypothetical protein